MARIQKLPPDLWTNLPVTCRDTVVIYYEGKERKIWTADSPKAAFEKVVAAGKKGYAAFAAAPIPCNEGQHGVFAFSSAGRTRDYINAKHVNELVTQAYNSVFANVQTQPDGKVQPMQTIVEDKTVLICEATIDEDVYGKEYTFIAEEELHKGKEMAAMLKSGDDKDVTLVTNTRAALASQLPHPLSWYATLHHRKPKEVEVEDEEIIDLNPDDPEYYDDLPE